MDLVRLFKWKYSLSLLVAGANSLCSVLFQLGVLAKLGVGARSDLYFASIVGPMVSYTLVFGALNNVLIPIFVENKASSNTEGTVLWNGIIAVMTSGVLIFVLLYYPLLHLFPVVFQRLKWIDLHQVAYLLLAYSVYQILYSALAVKNCFLLAEGRPVAAQAGVFFGWFLALMWLAFLRPGEPLWRIPLCLILGNTLALAWPNLPHKAFSYRRGFFRPHALSLASRVLPVALGGSITKLEPIFDGVVASFFSEGSLTVFYFFGRIMFYVSALTFSGYMQPEQKQLAEAASEKRWDALRRGTRLVSVRAILISLVFMVAIAFAFVFLFIARFAFLQPYAEYFNKDIQVFFLLLGYPLGLLICIAYSNSLYVLKQEKLFLFVSLTIFPVGVLFKLLGAHLFNLAGLAAGTSVYWLVYAGMLAMVFSKDIARREVVSAIRSPHLVLDQSSGHE